VELNGYVQGNYEPAPVSETSLEALPIVGEGQLIPQSRAFAASLRNVTCKCEGAADTGAADEMFRVAVEAAPAGIFITDASGVITLANKEARRLFGYEHNDLTGMPVDALIPERLRSRHGWLRAGFMHHRQTRRMGEGRELTALHSDGREIPVEISLQPIEASHGAGVLVVVTDISARKQAELEKVQRDVFAKLSAISAQAPLAIYSVDNDTLQVQFWNPATERLFGWGASEVLGKPLPTLAGLPREEVDRIVASLKAGDPVTGFETLRRRKDGTLVEVRLSTSSVQVDGSGQNLTAVFAEDISEEKRLRREHQQHAHTVEETLARLASVLDAASDGVLLVGRDGGILTANRAIQDFFPARDLGGLEGVHVGEWLAGVEPMLGSPDALRSLIERALVDPGIQPEGFLEQCWPEQRTLRVATVPVQDSGGPASAVLFGFVDVSEIRAASQAKDELLSLVGHELKAPLTAITASLDLLHIDHGASLDADVTEYLQIMEEAAGHLRSILDDLLDLSRIEAGRVGLQVRSMDMNGLVRHTLGTLRPLIEKKRHAVVLQLAQNLPRVYGDSVRLTQVLYNLVSNAVKYTNAGGTITITTAAKDMRVQVSVSDTGVGMTIDDQTRVFSKFFRAKHAAIRQESGTGLGLAITKLLVELHGGAIEFTSDQGKGTTFTFDLPITSAVPASTMEANGPKHRVLVVDDDARIGFALRRFLEEGGYDVAVVASGSAALKASKSRHYDAITLDLELPDMHGLQVLQALRAQPDTKDVPVVLVSGASITPEVRQSPASGILRKPIRREDLLALVGALVKPWA